MKIAVGILLLVEFDERAVIEHLLDEHFIFSLRAVAPMDAVGLGLLSNFFNPINECFVVRHDKAPYEMYGSLHSICSAREAGARM
jgi:hypothetical protein